MRSFPNIPGRLFVFYLGLQFISFSYAQPALSPSQVLRCKGLLLSLMTGELTPVSTAKASIAATEKKLEGLRYIGVVPWREHEITGINRKLVRYHGTEEFAHALPLFDKTQSLGVATVRSGDIRFSQLQAQNGSEGGFTVISNAQAFKSGELKVSELPKLRVWRDVDGNIWTLDHRRLAAMRLSGAIDEIPVEFVSEEVVRAQRFKFDTKNNGQSIFVTLPDNTAIVVGSDKLSLVTQRRTVATAPVIPKRSLELRNFLEKYPPATRQSWQAARGDAHFEKLQNYAHELSNSFDVLKKNVEGPMIETYSAFGKVEVRSKQETSVLAKLLRKDHDAFVKGSPGITNMKGAVSALGDAIGARVTLPANGTGFISPKHVDGFVDAVVGEIKEGVRISEIINYRAPGKAGAPYLNDQQVARIVDADRAYRLGLRLRNQPEPEPLIVRSGPKETFETGYTSFHMNIEYPSGIKAELQMRGGLMNEAAEIQHFFYDLRSGKPLSRAHKNNPSLLEAARKFSSLSEDKKNIAIGYVREQLIYVRKIEVGETNQLPPSLPTGLPKELSFENLKPHLLHD